ncbi:Ent-kaurene synthase [Lophiostoma macrostomum CBS 122681]|uniref:Ent-kaurene synthase n=1 Tax=Lophiostoma macrostomum CBS 122681 TaxID=1314788 RepID=A0A6A6TMT0_9PLEO|nr:Ent-kaurene synthase [Lophiostoma macrostomum CBS 122681]
MMGDLYEAAGALLSYLATGLKNESFFGCMSTSIYDTAWVSMVSKPSHGVRVWLFPKSFSYLLEHQSADGGWGGSSDLDRSLNTMAALLSLLKHNQQTQNLGCDEFPDRFQVQISRAIVWLDTHLRNLCIRRCADNVAFEVLLTSHLGFLASYGVKFHLPNLDDVLKLSAEKLNKLHVETIYLGQKDTILHSLEALVGIVDFDKLPTSLNRGSMMASPSSTAAYLINASNWDIEAEKYLLSVFEYGQGGSNGAFPSAYPTEIFETTWVFATLLEAGLHHTLSREESQSLAEILEGVLYKSGGILGFSHDILADADDTAKCLQCLNLLGRPTDLRPLITHFAGERHFKTYERERNCSLSANCNVLIALLSSTDPGIYKDSITKATTFICERWFGNLLVDKWNISREYSTHLITCAFTKLFQLSTAGKLGFISAKLREMDVPLVLVQVLSRTLIAQDRPSGSWGRKSHEISAYCILTLLELSKVPAMSKLVMKDLQDAVRKGRDFLGTDPTMWSPSSIWIEKVTYSSSVLTQAYCIAAMLAPLGFTDDLKMPSLGNPEKQASKLGSLFQSLPLFKRIPNRDLVLKCASIEGLKLMPYLEEKRLSIFTRSGLHAEKYLTTIPVAWTACNIMLGFPLSNNVLIEMLIVSMLNFQVDEFIESTCCLSKGPMGVERVIMEFIQDIFRAKRGGIDVYNFKNEPNDQPEDVSEHHCVLYTSLAQYIDAITGSRPAQSAQETLRWKLEEKLEAYLRAQVVSATLKTSQRPQHGEQTIDRISFIDWVRTTGADDTSCPYSFAFYLCAITTDQSFLDGKAFSPYEDYLLWDICSHLSTLCRMYNDYGSLARDRKEGQLNSIDFFQKIVQPSSSAVISQASGKRSLLLLAHHEREAVHQGLKRLRSDKELPKHVLPLLQLFINVTDLFGQIYVVKDIGTSTDRREDKKRES